MSASGTETTIYVGGLLERVTRGSVTEFRHLIHGGKGVAAIYTRRTSGSPLTDTFYVHADHLGSSELITNAAGAQVVKLSFGAYGERRDSDWDGAVSSGDMTTIGNTIRYGFTGHEHLDSVSLIHMNGRVYDPVVGRFLSADPFIDWGLGTQGVNRYGYVGNNPLSFVDPSGYTCETYPGLSDEEQAEMMTHCADAFDAGGWGPNNGNQSRYCDLLGDCRLAYGYPVDFGVTGSNSGEIPLSLAQQYALGQYNEMVGRSRDSLFVSSAGPDELVVTASRISDYESYRWRALTGATGGANGGQLLSATLPNGSQGLVAGGRASESANGGVAAIGVTAAFTQTLGGFLAWAEDYSLNGHYGSARVLRGFGLAGAVGGVAIAGYAAFDAYRQGDVSGMILHGAVFAGSVLVVSGVIGVSSGPGIVIGAAAVTVTVLDFTRGAP